MAKSDFKSVEQYIESQPEAVHATLKRVRSAIRRAVPGLEEVIWYKIPTYKLHGRPVLCFAGWKRHYSLYPAGPGVIETLKKELVPYEMDKSTIRFPLGEPVPAKLIERIAKIRAKEVSKSAKAKAAGSTARSDLTR